MANDRRKTRTGSVTSINKNEQYPNVLVWAILSRWRDVFHTAESDVGSIIAGHKKP